MNAAPRSGSAMSGPTAIAVLGAGGIMGFPVARNLARSGMTVTAWNRSGEKAVALADDGARVADSAAAAVAGADIVITMLADADAVLSCMSGALGSMDETATWVQLSTIGELGTDECARLARERGVRFVDAPVLGTRQPAEQGKLVILASGPPEARELLAPVFDVIGGKTIWLGEAGAGSRLKLVVNSWVLSVVEAGAETVALCEGLGLRPQLLFEALDGGALDLPYLRTKAKAMIERDFTPAFSLRLAAKDAGLITDAADRRDLDLPLLQVIARRLAEGARQHGEKDFSATYLTSAPPPDL